MYEQSASYDKNKKLWKKKQNLNNYKEKRPN